MSYASNTSWHSEGISSGGFGYNSQQMSNASTR